MTRTAAIVITYNSAAVVERCVAAALAQGMEVVVVDNASSDSSASKALTAGARVISNPTNAGFAAAANQGFDALTNEGSGSKPVSPYLCVLLLNPDVEITTSILPMVEATLAHGAACGLLQDIKNKPQKGFQLRKFPTPAVLVLEVLGINRIWKSNPINRAYRYFDFDVTKPGFVEQPAGAFLMVRADVWRSVGGFDSRFKPVWFEDVDFAKRLYTQGVRIAFVPCSTGRHLGGHSVGKMHYSKRITAWYASLFRYSCKHFSNSGGRCVAAAVLVAAGPRCFVGMLGQKSLTPLAVWMGVCNMALSVLWSGAGQKAVSQIASEDRNF